MVARSKSFGLHHRGLDPRGLDGFAAAILLSGRMIELGLKMKGRQ
jgi:hypothetical protein